MRNGATAATSTEDTPTVTATAEDVATDTAAAEDQLLLTATAESHSERRRRQLPRKIPLVQKTRQKIQYLY